MKIIKNLVFLMVLGMAGSAAESVSHSRTELLLYSIIFFLVFCGIPYGLYKIVRGIIRRDLLSSLVGLLHKVGAVDSVSKVVLLIIGLLFIYFYWFQWRPAEIRKKCAQDNATWALTKDNFYRNNYENCLHEQGL